MKKSLKSKKGQVAIEYILLISALVVVFIGVGNRIKAYLVGSGECPGNAFVCRMIDSYTGPDLFDIENRFRRFVIRPRKAE